jgi:hypothetical protein
VPKNGVSLSTEADFQIIESTCGPFAGPRERQEIPLWLIQRLNLLTPGHGGNNNGSPLVFVTSMI